MPDFEARSYRDAARALRTQRSALARYTEVVEAQKRALMDDDLDRVMALAATVDYLVGEIHRADQALASVYRRLRAGEVDGPRSRTLRDLMTEVSADGAVVTATVKELTLVLQSHRHRLMTVDRPRQVPPTTSGPARLTTDTLPPWNP